MKSVCPEHCTAGVARQRKSVHQLGPCWFRVQGPRPVWTGQCGGRTSEKNLPKCYLFESEFVSLLPGTCRHEMSSSESYFSEVLLKTLVRIIPAVAIDPH